METRMKLLILDGNSVINRAFYGIRPLSTRDGLYTNGIFGFLNILQRARDEESPDALCVAFDLHGPTFRHLQFDGYKATRHAMPEELAMQMPVMKDVLRAMNVPIYECQGWEADDVIGTVARRCTQENWQCVVLTGDRDSLQLVSDSVTVKLVRTQGGQTAYVNYTPQLFREEYGLEPLRLIDLKALMGDSSDNIPGVAGIGPKTATELLKKYGTLDGVYENLSPQNMKGKLFEKLQNGKDSAYLSYDLATIRTDAPIEDFSPEKSRLVPPKRRELYDLLVRLEFRKLLDRYGLRDAGNEPREACAEEPCITGCCTITEVAALPQLAPLLSGKPLFWASDAALSLIVVAPQTAGNSQTAYLLRRETLGEDFLPALKRLCDKKYPKIAHDCKPILRHLLELGIDAGGFVFDTAVAAYLLDATRGKYELSQLAQDYLHITPAETHGLPPENVRAIETACLEGLYDVFRQKLDETGMMQLYETVELPLCRVLACMEHDGVSVDRDALHDFGAMLTARIDACERIIYEAAGGEFNIQSTKQLAQVLFERLDLPPVKKTKSGYSTDAEVLERLRDRHPIVPAVMDYRVLTKLKSTYADGLQKQIAPDGRIHTTFQNLVTATGRLSSTEPNLQNIPVRTELGSEIRKMFIPREGWVFVDADYSQIELRVLAHIADDRAMQEAFRSGEDFHTVTAAQVFHVPQEAVTARMRRDAKAVNFGIVYGISEYSLAQDIGVTREQAGQYMNSYLDRYSGVRRYMHDIVQTARAQGYVETIFRRRRAIPEIASSNFNVRSGAERIALNTPIQGTAADIIKIAMLRVFHALEAEGLQARLVLQVHDELIVECPAFEALRVMELVTREMEQAAALSAPLVAEAKMGESWYEAK